MSYTPLAIYRSVGQYDEVCAVSFRKDSAAYTRYGDYITGTFHYTKTERAILQERLSMAAEEDEHGMVRFTEGLDRLPASARNALMKEGFHSADIISILADPANTANAYTQIGARSLPTPIQVRFDKEEWDELRSFIYLNEQRLSMGLQLTGFEVEKEIAYRFLLNDGQPPKDIPPDHYLDPTTGAMKPAIRYYLLAKKDRTKLTPGELTELMELLEQRSAGDLAILYKELEQSTERLKTVGIQYEQAIERLIRLISYFEPERLTLTKIPVWWNTERFLHIFIRHVSEVRVGERNEDKTAFQYQWKDIRDLIKLVLSQLASVIDQYFEENPGKPFKRHGNQSHYYRGDYYVIDIRQDGLLMTFYKKI